MTRPHLPLLLCALWAAPYGCPSLSPVPVEIPAPPPPAAPEIPAEDTAGEKGLCTPGAPGCGAEQTEEPRR